MSRAAVELDFFGLEREKAAKRRHAVEQRSSLRGIQSAIAGINPQLLRSMIASGSAIETRPPASAGFRPASAPGLNRNFISTPPSPFPVWSLSSSCSAAESPHGMAPLTIFYNGTVAVFDVSHDKAETILKLAEEEANAVPAFRPREEGLLERLHGGGDLPIARKRSLQRFLEKRKERLTEVAPYKEMVSST